MIIEGQIGENDVPSILQIPTLSQWTGELKIEHGNESGHLYYRDGNLLHAQVGEMRGNEAVYLVLHWNEGNFSFSPKEVDDTEVTISLDLQHIILEGLRRLDEEKVEKKGARNGEATGPFVDKSQEVLAAGYGEMRVPPAAVAVVGPQDELVAYEGDGEIENRIKSIACASSTFIKDLQADRNLDSFRELLLIDESGGVVIHAIKPGWAIIAITNSQANLGSIKLSLQKLARQLAVAGEE